MFGFLRPYHDAAFKVIINLMDSINIEMNKDNVVDKDIVSFLEALVNIDSSDDRLESIAVSIDGSSMGMDSDHVVQTDFAGEGIESVSAHEFGPHTGQRTFIFEGVFMEKEICHYCA